MNTEDKKITAALINTDAIINLLIDVHSKMTTENPLGSITIRKLVADAIQLKTDINEVKLYISGDE